MNNRNGYIYIYKAIIPYIVFPKVMYGKSEITYYIKL